MLSLITLMAIIFYASYKLTRLLSYDEYTVSMATEEQYYSSNFTFSQLDGFQVAAAVTSFD